MDELKEEDWAVIAALLADRLDHERSQWPGSSEEGYQKHLASVLKLAEVIRDSF